jgi:hypothetical protein
VHEAKPIEAQFNYLAPMAGKPAYYLYKPEPDVEKRVPENEPRTVAVHDARGRHEALSLDREGVALVPHQSAVEDFYDEAAVRSVYYPEVEQLVRRVTGASEVLVFDHNVRCGPAAERKQRGVSMPVRFVHNDYTEKSGPQRVRDLVGGEEAERRLEGRFAVINVWRSIGAPIEDTPLGICDAQTIAGEDCVATDLVYRDRTGEILSFRYSPTHRWYYFPRMHRDEAMLLKCFDSDRSIAGRFTAHSAFDDPSAHPDSPARESIEARTLVFY